MNSWFKKLVPIVVPKNTKKDTLQNLESVLRC